MCWYLLGPEWGKRGMLLAWAALMILGSFLYYYYFSSSSVFCRLTCYGDGDDTVFARPARFLRRSYCFILCVLGLLEFCFLTRCVMLQYPLLQLHRCRGYLM